MRPSAPPPLAALAALLLAGCAPQIRRFELAPRETCPDSPSELRWAITGEGSLSAEPPVDGLGALRGEQGAIRVHARRNTVFTLTARRGGQSVQQHVELTVLDPPPIGFATDVDGAGLLAAGDLPATSFDALARVDTITNELPRPMRVRHLDAPEVTLAPGASSDALRGARVAGRWELRAALLPGEQMGDPAHAPPATLHLAFTYRCAPR